MPYLGRNLCVMHTDMQAITRESVRAAVHSWCCSALLYILVTARHVHSAGETRPDQAIVDDKAREWLDCAAANLGVSASVLGTAMVTRELRIRGQEATRAVLNLTQVWSSSGCLVWNSSGAQQ